MLKKEHIAAKICKSLTWHFTGKDKELFLTFDDGPDPDITPWVLSILKDFDAKATFFCIGKNVEKYPDLYKQILKEGHSVGNHTYTHIKGWRVSPKKYVQNVQKASGLIKSDLFRPPYGRIRPKQIACLKKDYKIIMWDVLAKDYNRKLKREKCLQYILDYSESGSIIVLHDTIKAEKNLKFVLPELLNHFTKQEFIFNPIEFKTTI